MLCHHSLKVYSEMVIESGKYFFSLQNALVYMHDYKNLHTYVLSSFVLSQNGVIYNDDIYP